MISKFLSCAILILTLVGCSNTVPVKQQPQIVQENMLVYCPLNTPKLENYVLDTDGKIAYNGKEIMRVLLEWQSIYNKCATNNDTLVHLIRQLEKTKQVQIK